MPSQSDNAIQFTFGAPSAIPSDEALRAAIGVEADATPAEPQITPEVLTPLEATPAEETPEVVPAAVAGKPPAADPANPPAPSGDPLKTYTIKVDGKELVVTEKDLLEGHMRHKDYTQKTQSLSAERDTFRAKEQAYQQERDTLRQFLSDRQAVEAYLQKAFGSAEVTVPVPQIDPNKPPTAAEVAEIARYNAEQVRLSTRNEMETRLQAMQAQNQQERLAVQREKLGTAIDAHVATLLDQHPLLRKFEGIEEVLMADAQRGEPVKTLDEARARLSDVAERRAAILRSLGDEAKKEQAVAAATLKKTSPEPPGGKAPRSPAGKKTTLGYKDTSDRIAGGVELIEKWLASNS